MRNRTPFVYPHSLKSKYISIPPILYVKTIRLCIQTIIIQTTHEEVKRVKTSLSLVVRYANLIHSLTERMNLALVEPIRELFKDEVRVLGRKLGIPEQFVSRHSFFWSGQAIRVLGKVTRKKWINFAKQTPCILKNLEMQYFII